MTVLTITLKTKGTQIKGEIKKHEYVRKIVEDKDAIRLVINDNWETIVSKDLYRIVAIEY